MKRANITVSLLLIGISFFFIQRTRMIKEAAGATLGPRFFPYVMLWGIIVLSSIIIINTLRDKRKSDQKFVGIAQLINVLITFVMFTIYTYTIEKIGFTIATGLFLMALSTFYYGKVDKKLVSIGVFSVATPLLLYQLFNNFFKVLLP